MTVVLPTRLILSLSDRLFLSLSLFLKDADGVFEETLDGLPMFALPFT
jgi:hypothetical protein